MITEKRKAPAIMMLVTNLLAGSFLSFRFHRHKKHKITKGKAKTLNTCVMICPLIGLKPNTGIDKAKTLAIPVIHLYLLDCTSI